MNTIETRNPSWYKFIEETADKKELSIVNIGFNPEKGVYWDIPYEHSIINSISCKSAVELFKDDLSSITPAKIVLIDFLSRNILTTSIEFIEEVSSAIPGSMQTKWLYIEAHLIPCAIELFEKHLNNPAPDQTL